MLDIINIVLYKSNKLLEIYNTVGHAPQKDAVKGTTRMEYPLKYQIKYEN
jgi:hypothetical protein